MLATHDNRHDWQKEAVALAVDDYKDQIDAIVNDGDAGQEALEDTLAALETRLLTVCGMGENETNALLDRLYEEA